MGVGRRSRRRRPPNDTYCSRLSARLGTLWEVKPAGVESHVRNASCQLAELQLTLCRFGSVGNLSECPSWSFGDGLDAGRG